jgi:heme exporter protein C
MHILIGLAAAAVGTSLFWTFSVAPVEATMGIVQKIFYFHVPCAFSAFAGFILCGVGSLAFLIKRTAKADALAVSGAEVGLVFCFLVLTTGPLWARGAWGVWWVWDPQLTTTLLLLLIYLAYMFLREFAGDTDGGRRFAAVLGLLGTLDIYVIHTSVRRWRGQHPNVVRDGGKGLAPEMYQALWIGVVAIGLVFVLLVIARYRLERSRQALDRLSLDVAEVA